VTSRRSLPGSRKYALDVQKSKELDENSENRDGERRDATRGKIRYYIANEAFINDITRARGNETQSGNMFCTAASKFHARQTRASARMGLAVPACLR